MKQSSRKIIVKGYLIQHFGKKGGKKLLKELLKEKKKKQKLTKSQND